MAQFIAFDPRVEVIGQTILAILDGIPEFKELALGVLEKNGIRNLRRNSWHSQQAWLNAFRDIAQEIGGFTLYNIGRCIPETAAWPPDIDTLQSALASIDTAYHMNHRLDGRRLYDPLTGTMMEGIGHYASRQLSGRSAEMVCHNPYPCDFDRGIIAAVINKFKTADEQVSLKEEGECRKRGAESCTYLISW